jgi:hypothetical protein
MQGSIAGIKELALSRHQGAGIKELASRSWH